MTDFMPEEEQASGETPVPGAAPAPVPPVPQEATMTPEQSSRIAELEAELQRLRGAAVAGGKALLRVLPPHVLFTHAGVTVGTGPTPVPERLVPALMAAAGGAGVTLTQEG
jgi:hypothetical protein